jgi:hypothetical protein
MAWPKLSMAKPSRIQVSYKPSSCLRPCCRLRIGPDNKTLWTLDHKLYGTVGRPRLLVLDIENNGKVVDEYIIPMHVAPILSFMNDFSFSPDGKRLVIVDSLAHLPKKPALITLDIATRKFARKLQGHVSVQDAGFDMYVYKVNRLGHPRPILVLIQSPLLHHPWAVVVVVEVVVVVVVVVVVAVAVLSATDHSMAWCYTAFPSTTCSIMT